MYATQVKENLNIEDVYKLQDGVSFQKEHVAYTVVLMNMKRHLKKVH